MTTPLDRSAFVNWFRASSPYIHAFRGRTFVITFDGSAVVESRFPALIHDIALLHSLGIKLLLVHGARPQVEACLTRHASTFHYANGIRVTDAIALKCVKEAAGSVRVEIEALLSMGLANSPMAGARIRVASGNFVTARPVGVRDGIDYQHTGEVRRVDTSAINQQLDNGSIVLLSPLGYSPTGEVFNLSALEVATTVATELKADKLLCLTRLKSLKSSQGVPLRQLTLGDADALISGRRRLPDDTLAHLREGIRACRGGVRRTHLLDQQIDGVLLMELFTRDGIGAMITADAYENMRQAQIEDVGGLLELIAPLEQEGTLVRRSREQLELEIGHFHVVERDRTIIACAALYPDTQEKWGELACLVVHHDYRKLGWGDLLLERIEQRATELGLTQLFVLTTRTLHWFRERGFIPIDLNALPVKKRTLYNFQRNSKVLMKELG